MLKKIPPLFWLPLASLAAGLVLYPYNQALRNLLFLEIPNMGFDFTDFYLIYMCLRALLAVGAFLLLAFLVARRLDKQTALRSAVLLSCYNLAVYLVFYYVMGKYHYSDALYYIQILFNMPCILYSSLNNILYLVFYSVYLPSTVYVLFPVLSSATPLFFVLFARGLSTESKRLLTSTSEDPWDQ